MYDLRLSAEQLAIRWPVREFPPREVKPRSLAPTRLEARDRPLLLEVLDAASQMGLRALALSEDLGGAGADALTCCIVAEELAAGDPHIAAVLAETSMLAHVLFDRVMTQEQRERLLPPFLADHRYHLARAEREPDRDGRLGGKYHRAEPVVGTYKTTAIRSGNVFVINGFKHCVANAPVAKLFTVDVGLGSEETGTLLVPHDAEGLSVTESKTSPRWWLGVCGELRFTDCRVGADNLLVQPLTADAGRGIPQAQALNLGIGRAAYEAALDYAQLRVQGGRRLIEHQAIGAKLADIVIRLELSRAAIWQAAWACDHPEAAADRSLGDLPLANIAQAFSSDAIYRATKDAAECFGAMGVMRDMPLQQYVRDTLICLHTGAGNSEAKLRIAEALAGYRRTASAAALAAE